MKHLCEKVPNESTGCYIWHQRVHSEPASIYSTSSCKNCKNTDFLGWVVGYHNTLQLNFSIPTFFSRGEETKKKAVYGDNESTSDFYMFQSLIFKFSVDQHHGCNPLYCFVSKQVVL